LAILTAVSGPGQRIHLVLPLKVILAFLAFFGQAAWQERSGGRWTALAISIIVALGGIVFAAIYWLNQYSVHSELEPRRRELETLLRSLEDETPGAI
jgi:hypothetical protein